MRTKFFRLALILLAGLALVTGVGAADKVSITINGHVISAYRTVDLESAKKEAIAAKKPIAWIASSPTLLDGKGNISQRSGRGATLHAFYALRDRAVLVFMDAFAENHQVIGLVDNALHTPNPHYTPPTVVFLDPQATNVLATVVYEVDFQKRANDLARALEEIKGKF